jgi:hypothetical protein
MNGLKLRLFGAVTLAAMMVCCTGCRKPGPEVVAKNFVAAMSKGDLEQAARYWDFITYARRENPDWDTFGTSQRNLIVKELAKDQARELEFWRTYFPRACTVEEISIHGERAVATLTGGRAGEIHLVHVDDAWYVDGIK